MTKRGIRRLPVLIVLLFLFLVGNLLMTMPRTMTGESAETERETEVGEIAIPAVLPLEAEPNPAAVAIEVEKTE